jgi:hypothetical protein
MLCNRRIAAALVALALAACDETTTTEPRGGAGAGGTGTGQEPQGGSGGDCAVNPAPMFVAANFGVASRLHVPVDRQGEAVALLFDTGSALSFFFLGQRGPTYVEHSGDVGLGCDIVPMAGRNFDLDEPVNGLSVVGILGADYLLGGVSQIDTATATLTRRIPAELPAEQAEWPAQSFDDVQGHIIVPVKLDGEPVRLMFDTGSPEILWLGEEAQPGDVPVTTTDAKGNELTLYLGQVMLEIAGEPPVMVPVMRAPSFPYFEQTVAQLGGNIHGLLGLSALRGRSLVVDPNESELHLSP